MDRRPPQDPKCLFNHSTPSCFYSHQLEADPMALLLEGILGGFAKTLHANLAPLMQTTLISCLY